MQKFSGKGFWINQDIKTKVSGWALDPKDSKKRLSVRLLHQGVCIYECKASRSRSHLAKKFNTDGRHGFNLYFPASMFDGVPRDFEIEIPDLGKTISISSLTLPDRQSEEESQVPDLDEMGLAHICESEITVVTSTVERQLGKAETSHQIFKTARTGREETGGSRENLTGGEGERSTLTAYDASAYREALAGMHDEVLYRNHGKNDPIEGADASEAFLMRGIDHDSTPSCLFDPVWYRSRYQAPDDSTVPLIHFLTVGWPAGHQPHALFVTDWYANQFKDVDFVEQNPLEHYQKFGRLKDMAPTPCFDYKWYAKKYPESTLDGKNAFIHYMLEGRKLGYLPNPYIDVNFYSRQYPNDERARSDTLVHYLLIGANEGADPSPHFSTLGYLESYQDIKRAGLNPLEHFLRRGKAEGRSPLGKMARRVEVNSSMGVFSRFGRPEYGPVEHILKYDAATPAPIDHPSICVHFHLFHIDAADEVCQYLSNIKIPFTLLLSVQPDEQQDWRAYFATRIPSIKKCVVKGVPNIGRDVAPWVLYFADEIISHELFFHGHSKKSDYNTAYAGWRRYLFHQTLGSDGVVNQIISLFNSEKTLGLVYPAYFPALEGQPAWGANRGKAEQICDMIGLPPPAVRCPDYPSGSFFWARVALIKPLLTAGLKPSDFEPEEGQIDGTIAHAIERQLGDVGRAVGLRKLCTTVDVAYNLTNFWDVARKEASCRDQTVRYRSRKCSSGISKGIKIAVFSAVTGKFDELCGPPMFHPDVDYYLYSDVALKVPEPWQNKISRYIDVDPRRTARFVKTHPHILLAGYDISIWLDANVMLTCPLSSIVQPVLESTSDVGVIYHAVRTNYLDEAKECIRIGADEEAVLNEQLESYANADINTAPLIETNIIVSNLANPNVGKFYNAWWREIARHSVRDQVSINFAIREAGIVATPIMPKGRTARDSGMCVMFDHRVTGRKQILDFVESQCMESVG